MKPKLWIGAKAGRVFDPPSHTSNVDGGLVSEKWLRAGAGRRPALLLAFALALVVRAAAETLTLATYNVENYGPANRMTEAGYRKDYPKPEAEKQALRTVIRGLAADVLVVQEMGEPAYVEELRRDLKTEGLDYPYSALASAGDGDRRVALISRRPLKSVTTHTDLTFKYLGGQETVKRGLLEVTLATSAGDVTIFALHLKSRLPEHADDPTSAIRRAGEAVAIRDRILKRFPEPATARFVILGDCNDHRASRPLAALQKRGKTDIAVLLRATDSRGDVWSYTYRKEESYSRVDHILVSPALKAAVDGGSGKIYDGPGVREASDHRPVWVRLKWGE